MTYTVTAKSLVQECLDARNSNCKLARNSVVQKHITGEAQQQQFKNRILLFGDTCIP